MVQALFFAESIAVLDFGWALHYNYYCGCNRSRQLSRAPSTR